MKIMIVDDEPKIRRGMKTLLEEQCDVFSFGPG